MTIEEIQNNKEAYLAHIGNGDWDKHNYVEKRQGKNGKWYYIYPDDLAKSANAAANTAKRAMNNVVSTAKNAVRSASSNKKGDYSNVSNGMQSGNQKQKKISATVPQQSKVTRNRSNAIDFLTKARHNISNAASRKASNLQRANERETRKNDSANRRANNALNRSQSASTAAGYAESNLHNIYEYDKYNAHQRVLDREIDRTKAAKRYNNSNVFNRKKNKSDYYKELDRYNAASRDASKADADYDKAKKRSAILSREAESARADYKKAAAEQRKSNKKYNSRKSRVRRKSRRVRAGLLRRVSDILA